MFVYLEFSNQIDYDPRPMIEALQLVVNEVIDVVEQKDAHQFMFLLVNILSRGMMNPNQLLDIITGEIIQKTVCQKCLDQNEVMESFTSLGFGFGSF